jgi:hypothetical protein
MENKISFEQIHANAAGIDVGSEKLFVSVDGVTVKNFGTCTCDHHDCIKYLQDHHIERVAMEATGVYWLSLYGMLEASGIKVSLVNPKQTKQQRGKKTDVKDCQWIQKLFAAGLLQESFVPEERCSRSVIWCASDWILSRWEAAM